MTTEYFVGLEEKDFEINKNWLVGALLHFANKEIQTEIQRFYFWIRGSKPSPTEVRALFRNSVTVSIAQGKEFPTKNYKGVIIGSGLFERLIYSEDIVFEGVKKKCFFLKKDEQGPWKEVDKNKAVKRKRDLKRRLGLN